MQQMITWLDNVTAADLDDELIGLEDDQAFLEQFYGVTMLLDALGQAEELDLDEDEDLVA